MYCCENCDSWINQHLDEGYEIELDDMIHRIENDPLFNDSEEFEKKWSPRKQKKKKRYHTVKRIPRCEQVETSSANVAVKYTNEALFNNKAF